MLLVVLSVANAPCEHSCGARWLQRLAAAPPPASDDSLRGFPLLALDSITVVAKRLYSKDSFGFERRKRIGMGYFFDAESIRRSRPSNLYWLMYQVPSLRVADRGLRRAVYMGLAGGNCKPTLFLNGARMPDDLLADIDILARPDELEGMEIYRGTQTPPEFATFDGCGAIVIWTRQPARVSR